MGIANVLSEEIRREGVATERMLERVPKEKFDWRPHQKSMSLGELATHLATIPQRAANLLRAGEFDVTKARPSVTPNPEMNLVDEYRRNIADFVGVVESLDNDGIKAAFVMRRGDQVLREMTKSAMIRAIGMNHSYHHRGQLSVYLRLLDVPVPATYGTSADE